MFPQLYSVALISGAVPLRNKSTPQAWAQALSVGVQAMMRYENWEKEQRNLPFFLCCAIYRLYFLHNFGNFALLCNEVCV